MGRNAGDLCDLSEMETERRGGYSRWSAMELGMRLGELSWRREGRAKDLQLAYLLPWPESILQFYIT